MHHTAKTPTTTTKKIRSDVNNQFINDNFDVL